MRFVLLGPTYPFRGGISHYNTILYQELAKTHEVTLLSLTKQYPSLLFPGKTQVDESGEAFDVQNERILAPLSPRSWRRTIRRVREINPDLAVFQWWHPFFGPAFGSVARGLAKGSSPIPTCFVCHNVQPHESSFVDTKLSRYAFSPISTFLVHSQLDRENLESICPGRPTRVTPHPTYSAFKDGEALERGEARKSLGLNGKPTLLYFGNIRKYKGLPYLVEAMPSILERIDCNLLIVGEFYYDGEPLKTRIRELGLERRVRLVSRYVPNEEVKTYFSASDLVVLPYISATQSGIAQIAFAFERPVVGTDVGGIPEAVLHDKTGLIVPPKDSEALSRAVLRFFEENLSEAFVRNIREDAARFSWSCLVEKLEQLASEAQTAGASSN